MTQSGHSTFTRLPPVKEPNARLNSPLTWCVYGKVFDTGLSNWLRIELHKFHDLKRHAHFDRKAERSGFGGGECVIMCPVSTCQLLRNRFGRRLL